MRFVFVMLSCALLFEPSQADRNQRLEFMKADLERYVAVAAENRDQRLTLSEEPLLRYSNPVRNFFSDGGLFLWLDGQRPMAAATVSIRGKGKVFHELTSLTAQPLECRRNGTMVWSPRTASLADQTFSDAPAPDSSQKQRLKQMRDLARRFRVKKSEAGDSELRLMTQPLWRFSAKGITDGALFAFVEATDPDLLLVIEAHEETAASPAEWYFTLARACSDLEVTLDGKKIWSVSGYYTNPRSPDDPYCEIPAGYYSPAQSGTPNEE